MISHLITRYYSDFKFKSKSMVIVYLTYFDPFMIFLCQNLHIENNSKEIFCIDYNLLIISKRVYKLASNRYSRNCPKPRKLET